MGIVKQLLDDELEVVATDYSIEKIDIRAKRVACDIFKVENLFVYFGEAGVLLHLACRNGLKHDSLNHINDFPCHYSFIESTPTNP